MTELDDLRMIAELAVAQVPEPFQQIVLEATATEHSLQIFVSYLPVGDDRLRSLRPLRRYATLFRQLHDNVRRSGQERWRTGRVEIAANGRFEFTCTYADAAADG